MKLNNSDKKNNKNETIDVVSLFDCLFVYVLS